MGKTPSKWFKTLLLGKKSPKPKLSKDKDIVNPAYVGERDTLGSLNAPPTGLTGNPPPKLLPISKANGSDEVHQDEMVAERVPNVATPSPIRNADELLLLQTHSLEDHEKVRLHEAATKAQAAYRGYLARRAFRTLKGIVRLQALIRGHLVRRQAVATLCCMRSIVKLQAIIRSRKDPLCAPLMKFQVKLLRDVYIQKLLSLTLSARPLHLQYAPGDPNSLLEWLERWTKSRFWDPPPVQQLKKKSKSQPKPKPKQLAEIDQTRPQRSARKLPSSNGGTGPSRSSSQTEKVKRHVGKASVDPASQNGNEKSKVNLRRKSDPVKVVESDKKKSDQNAEKLPDTPTYTPACDEVVEPITTMNNTGQEYCVETIYMNTSLEPAGEELLHDLADELSLTGKTAAATEKELNIENVNENQQSSNRRVSLPTKMENGSSSSIPRRPSYMAPTKSAKAKLRPQGSSSPPTDDADKSAEKNGYTRRLSLPNGKVTSFSPRAHKVVEAPTTKAAIKVEKSLPSSRDGSDKANKADWKR